MIVQTIKVNDCTPQTIVIGRRGTYDTLQIAFDLSYLVESYGDGVAVLAVKRSQDSSAYPAVTSQEDDLLLWTVSETDTYYVGAGECQLMWYVDGGLAKTIIYPMVVMKDILMTSEEAPDAYQEWVDSLIAEGAETLQNAQNAAQSASDAEQAKDDAVTAKEAAEAILEEFTTPTASATTLSAGSQATATYSDGNFAFGIPKGADGDPGDPGVTPDFSIGTVTTLEPTQPATATITGTAEAPVLNLGIPKGAKGDPGQGGGSVNSVNGKTGDVVLDAGDLEFDDSETYAAGSIGAEVSQQKNAIDQKQDVTSYVTLSGTIVTQTGADNTMYLCGELAELTFTAPATGQTAIRFTSGTTPTVATFSGVTWLNGFDPTAIEASKTYEVNILYGVGVASWT